MSELTHVNEAGRPRMVGVSDKDVSERMARARGELRCQPSTYETVQQGKTPKGDLFEVARVAGVMAAKQTASSIPFCHPINLTDVDVHFRLSGIDSGPDGLERGCIEIEAVVEAVDRTGVEMEALHAVSTAALTLYDMIKGIDRTAVIGRVRLVEKRGGKSGRFEREEESWPETERR